jgi:two-component system phosphate regulon sensor histidine kinase PhoR
MKKDFFAIIIALMIISLIGIIGIQLLWLKNAIEVKKAQTDNAINEVLAQVIQNIETKETVTIISNVMTDSDSVFNDTIVHSNNYHNKIKKKKSTVLNINSLDDLDQLDSLGEDIEQIIKEISTSINFKINVDNDDEESNFEFSINSNDNDSDTEDNQQAVFISGNDSNFRIKINQLVNNKTEKVINVVEKMIYENDLSDKPLKERINTKKLMKNISEELINRGFNYSFDAAIINEKNDSIIFSSSDNYIPILDSKYKTNLFPNDILTKKYKLYLKVNGISSQMYKSISLPLIGSIIFTLIILIIFIISIITIINQKKISEIKTDFINNMTHEFKTPIATISLAVDSIENEKVITEPKKIKYFTNLIKDENTRMNSQVENILQASLIDNEKFDLNLKTIDVSPIIEKAVKNIKLQIEQGSGSINLELLANNSNLYIDEIHFGNIINNLLDNANKYSDSNPNITVKTENNNANLQISVSDQGIGMSKDVRKRIFEKFYRQTHGNIHNVKGFGLGLSYVQAIVTQFGGTIKVESEEGKGSTFTINLPTIEK